MHRFRVKRHVKREVRFDAVAGAACIDKTEPSDPRCGLGAYVRSRDVPETCCQEFVSRPMAMHDSGCSTGRG